MIINKSQKGEALTIAVIGRLDARSAPALEVAVKESTKDLKSLTFDVSELEYISSAGLRVFLLAQKIMNARGTMVVSGANKTVMEIFEITGFTKILTFI